MVLSLLVVIELAVRYTIRAAFLRQMWCTCGDAIPAVGIHLYGWPTAGIERFLYNHDIGSSSVDLMDLLKGTGADAGMGAISRQLGLSSGDAGKLLKALSPAVTHGLQRQAESNDGLSNFKKALEKGGHQRYLQDPELLSDEETRLDGNKILGHLFGSKDVSRNVAAHAAKETGIDSSLIRKVLPLLAPLVMAAVSKSTNAGKDLPSRAGGNLGGLAGMLLGKDKDSGIADIISLARKFF
jgi:hypothetical protein